MPASREELFRACSTAPGLEGWYADSVRGRMSPGQPVHLEWPGVGAALDLELTELNPERSVVFEGGGTRVTLTVGDQVLSIAHEGVPKAALAGLRSSWRVALALLAHGLECHPGKPRAARWEVRQVRATPELVHLCFTESSALGRWLGDSPGIGREGDPFSLRLGESRDLSGTVLAQSDGHDVAVSIAEVGQSFLSLRTLPSSTPGCHVALCWSTWTPIDEGTAELFRELGRAMDRLSGLLARSGAT